MSDPVIGLVGVVALLLLLATGMHIAWVMALVGFLGACYLVGLDSTLSLVGMTPYNQLNSFLLTCLPLFVLMGYFAFHGGISSMLYDAAYKWLGHLPGGLGMATVTACTAFAAVTGSSVATAAAMGTVALPEMKRRGYSDAFATGCVAAGGTVGIMIPPSIPLVVYGMMTEQSIGQLFMAGLLPGILVTVLYMITIAIQLKINPSLAPRVPRAPVREMVGALPKIWPAVILFGLVIGGIYVGLFTPTEAAAVGALGAFILAVARGMRWKGTVDSLLASGRTAAMIFAIIIGALIYNYFLAVSGLPTELSAFIVSLPIPPTAVLFLIVLVFIVLGCFLEVLSLMLLTIPIFFSVVTGLGYHPIWFGILLVRTVEIALITPPVGMNLYVVKGVAEVPLGKVLRGIVPFFLADLLSLVLLVAFPQIALFLPSMLVGK